MTLAFSSETAYARADGMEVLSHEPSAVNLERMNDGAPLLVNHDDSKQVGVVESARVDGTVGRAVVRFGKSALAEEIFRDVVDGIRRKVSVSYTVDRTEPTQDGYIVKRWTPLEVSIVSVPADATVGVGRTLFDDVEEESHESRASRGDDENRKPAENGDNTKGITMKKEDMVADEKLQAMEKKLAEATEVARKQEGRAEEIREIYADARLFAPMMKSGFDALEAASVAAENGTSAREFKERLRANVESDAERLAGAQSGVELNERERSEYNIGRALDYLIHGEKYRGFEVELTEEALKKSPLNSRGGKRQIIVPHGVRAALPRDDRASRGITTSTGYNTTMEMPVDMVIRNNLAMVDAGATRVTNLTQTPKMYRQTAGLTVYNVAESAAITESDTSVSSYTLTPHRAGGYTTISREAEFSSQFDLAQMHINDIFEQVAQNMDVKSISGTGTNEPTGILNTSGIGGSSSASYSYETATEQEADCKTNRMITTYLMNRSARGKLKARAIEPGSGDRIIDIRTGEMNGMPVVTSDNVPENTVIYGAFADVIIAEFGGYNLIADEYTQAEEGVIRLIGDVLFDVYIRQPERFSVADGGTI